MKVKNKQTGEVHEVWKYIKNADGEIHIWCNSWYGHHIIGNDCEFETEQSPDARLIEALEKIRQMKREPGETSDTYVFNRCWDLADTALNNLK